MQASARAATSPATVARASRLARGSARFQTVPATSAIQAMAGVVPGAASIHRAPPAARVVAYQEATTLGCGPAACGAPRAIWAAGSRSAVWSKWMWVTSPGRVAVLVWTSAMDRSIRLNRPLRAQSSQPNAVARSRNTGWPRHAPLVARGRSSQIHGDWWCELSTAPPWCGTYTVWVVIGVLDSGQRARSRRRHLGDGGGRVQATARMQATPKPMTPKTIQAIASRQIRSDMAGDSLSCGRRGRPGECRRGERWRPGGGATAG